MCMDAFLEQLAQTLVEVRKGVLTGDARFPLDANTLLVVSTLTS